MTLMAAMLPLLAFAGDWIEMYSQNGETYYIYSSIEDEYDEYDEYNDHLVWVKTTYDTPESRNAATEKYKQAHSIFESKLLMAFNSNWSKVKEKTVIFYKEDGKPLSNNDIEEYCEWKHIIPDSFVEIWRDYARELYNSAKSNFSEE